MYKWTFRTEVGGELLSDTFDVIVYGENTEGALNELAKASDVSVDDYKLLSQEQCMPIVEPRRNTSLSVDDEEHH